MQSIQSSRVPCTLALILVLAPLRGAEARDIHVPADLPTIQLALKAAQDGDRVIVAPGVYREDIVVDKAVEVFSSGGPKVTTIEGTGGGSVVSLLRFSADFRGFTITGGNAQNGGGILVKTGKAEIEDCIVTGNRANRGGGVYMHSTVWYGLLPNFVNCRIVDNTAETGGGVYMGDLTANVPELTNCVVAFNTARVGGGIAIVGSDDSPTGIDLNSCTVFSNAGGGLDLNPGSPLGPDYGIDISNSIFWANTPFQLPLICDESSIALWHLEYSDIEDSSSLGGCNGNFEADPVLIDPDGGDFRLRNGSPCIDRGTSSGAPSFDLEGLPRPLDGDKDGTAIADVGAHEFDPRPAWNNYGDGFPGSLGVPPLTLDTVPALGSTVNLQIGNSLGAPTLAILFIGPRTADIPSGFGGVLLVESLFPPLAVSLATSGAQISLRLPNDNAFCGLDMFWQALVQDPGAAKGVSFTRGLRTHLGR